MTRWMHQVSTCQFSGQIEFMVGTEKSYTDSVLGLFSGSFQNMISRVVVVIIWSNGGVWRWGRILQLALCHRKMLSKIQIVWGQVKGLLQICVLTGHSRNFRTERWTCRNFQILYSENLAVVWQWKTCVLCVHNVKKNFRLVYSNQ